TLRSIAQAAYGDNRLWWKIAQANGLSGDSDLRVGQTLSLPSATPSYNAADSFKPYDPASMGASAQPHLVMPEGGCGVVGQIIMVIIIAVVSYFTAGTATGPMTAALGPVAGTVAAGAIGGAVGALAGQAFAVASGMQEDFNWGAVAMGAVGGAMGNALQGINFVGNSVGNAMVRSAIANATTQGVAVATGLQQTFSWRAVAASAIGSGVSTAVSGALSVGTTTNVELAGPTQDGEALTGMVRGQESILAHSMGRAAGNFTHRLLTGMVAGATTAVLRGGRFSVQQVAADAFGNALGSSLAAESTRGSQQEDVLGQFIDEQLQAQDRRDFYS
ncbi:LysM peptidoglycan-binding domain-containing protein, partial [Methylibium rhizosphaerae]|uniref:LysM peptidoglycan-binding domain-containing protein n=1 Tax=Methylibium rhizosphaerae TaxID=2570323 RepID=UPI00112AE84C